MKKILITMLLAVALMGCCECISVSGVVVDKEFEPEILIPTYVVDIPVLIPIPESYYLYIKTEHYVRKISVSSEVYNNVAISDTITVQL